MPIDKVVATFDEAVADVADGSMVHIGGFGGPAEYPSYLIAALARKGVTGLTITGNHSGFSEAQLAMMKEHMASLLGYPDDYFSPGFLVERGQVAKGILAFPVLPGGRLKVPFEALLEEGKVELELIGQGSLAERIRAAARGHRRVLHAGRCGDGHRGGQGRPLVRRPSAHPRDRAQSRRLDHPRPQGRPLGQPRVPRHGAYLQRDDGGSGARDDRRSRRHRRARRPRPRMHHHSRALRAACRDATVREVHDLADPLLTTSPPEATR